MFKLLTEKETKKDTIEMRDMKPYDIAIIVDPQYVTGNYVMRTADTNEFEVMDLSMQSNEGSCWTGNPNIKVKLLKPGDKITFEVQ